MDSGNAFDIGNGIEDNILGQINISLKLRNIKEEIDLSRSGVVDSLCEVIAGKIKASNTIKKIELDSKIASANKIVR